MLINPFQTAVLFLIALSIPVKGHCQTYQFATPMSGYLGLSFSDAGGGNHVSQWYYGNAGISLSTLMETVTYDPVNLTLRQVGYITVNNADASATINETPQVNGQTIKVTVTVQEQIVGGIIPFDSGPIHAFTPLVGGQVTYHSGGFTIPIPVSGSYSLATGGQIYTGDFNPNLYFNGPGSSSIDLPFDMISTNGDATSPTLSSYGNLQTGGWVDAGVFGAGGYYSGFTAANGFNTTLSLGPGDDGLNWFSLGAISSVTATLVTNLFVTSTDDSGHQLLPTVLPVGDVLNYK